MSYNPFPEGAKSFPIHEGEHLLTPGYVTDIELRVPATMQGPKRKEMAKGSVFLTDQRVRGGSVLLWPEFGRQAGATFGRESAKIRVLLMEECLARLDVPFLLSIAAQSKERARLTSDRVHRLEARSRGPE